ncbi:MAG: excinuclease ABC subunit UvrC [Clostridiales bacterium]|nr:excinuclease ABC subunit UvrC [Clostridiales bacterium]
MFNIQEELKKLPQKSGVYIMKDKELNIIYVGKAINLRNRVRSYFRESNPDVKTRKLASVISEFEYIVTDSELEALVLENNLIKKHRPKYNIRLKDNKTYPYLKVTTNENFPRIYLTRKIYKDKAKYYGPYDSAYAIRETIDVIRSIWPIRQCDKNFPKDIRKSRPCLNHHIGRCLAPCNCLINEEDYGKMVDEILLFLNGKYDNIIARMDKEMAQLAEDMMFEKAAVLRDKISSIKKIRERQKADALNNAEQDVVAFAHGETESLFYVFFIRAGKITGSEHFMADKTEDSTKEEIMTAFIKQFYNDTSFIPKEIITETEINDKELISKYLSGIKNHNVTIKTPQKGEKHHLVELAHKNAQMTLTQFGDKIKREKEKTGDALLEIKETLSISFDISRLEAYDISNTSGVFNVASMVVFENGKPKRSDYRKFKIKTVAGPDDYASMEEVIKRRFTRYLTETQNGGDGGKFNVLPGIVLIDGGKGQVSAALAALEYVGISVPVCGMVKDDNHRTRGLFYNGEEFIMPRASEGFKLITRIQDEVHRFAIEYHRKLRGKEMIKSVLDEIKGIGKLRRQALLKEFGSVEVIKNLTTDELLKANGMNRLSAQAVYDHFHEIQDEAGTGIG